MRLQFPAGKLTVVRNGENGLKMIERKLNQNPLYFLTYQGFTVRCGKKGHIARHFNRYNNALKTLSTGG
jgi:hypothetical protein